MRTETRTVVVAKAPHVPPMSAQHFFYVADVMAKITAERPSKNVVVEALADAFEATNPNFQREFFVAACNGLIPR